MSEYSDDQINHILKVYKSQRERDKVIYQKRKENPEFVKANRVRSKQYYDNNKERKAEKYLNDKKRNARFIIIRETIMLKSFKKRQV